MEFPFQREQFHLGPNSIGCNITYQSTQADERADGICLEWPGKRLAEKRGKQNFHGKSQNLKA